MIECNLCESDNTFRQCKGAWNLLGTTLAKKTFDKVHFTRLTSPYNLMKVLLYMQNKTVLNWAVSGIRIGRIYFVLENVRIERRKSKMTKTFEDGLF